MTLLIYQTILYIAKTNKILHFVVQIKTPLSGSGLHEGGERCQYGYDDYNYGYYSDGFFAHNVFRRR